MAPVALLLILCVVQTIEAGPVMRFMQATALSLHAPQHYIRDVLGSSPSPPSPETSGR
jgi:multicomponent K+:H+ antiporter subunit D